MRTTEHWTEKISTSELGTLKKGKFLKYSQEKYETLKPNYSNTWLVAQFRFHSSIMFQDDEYNNMDLVLKSTADM